MKLYQYSLCGNQNEKRKDQDLTNRINKILKMRDEVTKGVDMRACIGPTATDAEADICSDKIESTVDGLVRGTILEDASIVPIQSIASRSGTTARLESSHCSC